MNAQLRHLLEILQLDEIAPDRFRGENEADRHGRLFGGQVAAQALAAAGRSVPGRSAHSLHAYFLLVGDPEQPVGYHVERTRDGRSFSTRRVAARQRDKTIFSLEASFQIEEQGYEHQLAMPDAPAPESLPTQRERVQELGESVPMPWAKLPRAIDMRHAIVPAYLGGKDRTPENFAWFRTPDPLPDDPLLHQCVLTYATDMSFNDNAIRVHGGFSGERGLHMMASLDHAMWFHHPVRVDDWLLFHQETPSASRGRGFVRGSIFDRAGTLVASVTQESLMRLER